VVIYVEPRNGQEKVVANTARTSLLLNDEPLPWAEWAAEFRSSMPEPIKNIVEEVSAISVGHDHRQSIRERLKQILELFKLSRYRPSPSGSLNLDEGVSGGMAPEGSGSAKNGGGKRGGSGGNAGDIYALFQAPLGSPGEELRSPVPDPSVRWISVKDGSRAPAELEDRAAKYLPQQDLLMINADFRVFTDMVERWCQKYSHVSGARPAVESAVHEWFEQQLVETVMGALSLRGSSEWAMPDLEKVWNEEALTAAVLPRYHIDVSVKRALGGRLGSLKEQIA
jgi:hypothetical protein